MHFGPFKHIVFVIISFESPSKTLFRVLFASLYLQICIFYHGISISCPAVSSRLEVIWLYTIAFDFQTPINRYNVNNDYNYRSELVDRLFLNRMVVFLSLWHVLNRRYEISSCQPLGEDDLAKSFNLINCPSFLKQQEDKDNVYAWVIHEINSWFTKWIPSLWIKISYNNLSCMC
jgi:hypothetical protein